VSFEEIDGPKAEGLLAADPDLQARLGADSRDSAVQRLRQHIGVRATGNLHFEVSDGGAAVRIVIREPKE